MSRKPQNLSDRVSKLFGAELAETLQQSLTSHSETVADKLHEGQSVLNYFATRGKGFKTEVCRTCELTFAYSLHFDGVKYCSITCMREALHKIGLQWNSEREPERRWGAYRPAIVPPAALSIVGQVLASQESQPQETLDEWLQQLVDES